jgi:pilus assembly protein CpaB
MAFKIPKINTNWLFLIGALVLGGGAVYLSNSLLTSRITEIEEEAKRGKQMVQVVVAKRDLERGEPMTPENVAVRQVPKEFSHESAIKPNQFDAYENQRVAVPLKKGEELLSAHVEGNGSNVFSATLKKGLRALTFEVDAVNSISGMLRPGDRIDLIYSNRNSNADGSEITLPLLSNVSVLATDQTLTKRDEETGKERSFSTITLEISALDANRIIVAKSSGQLTAVLRNPDDKAPNFTAPLTVAQLMGRGMGGRGSTEGVIEYIVGGGGGPAEVQMNKLLPALRAAAGRR